MNLRIILYVYRLSGKFYKYCKSISSINVLKVVLTQMRLHSERILTIHYETLPKSVTVTEHRFSVDKSPGLSSLGARV